MNRGSSGLGRLPTKHRSGKGRFRVLRILLVDDDPGLRTLLKTTFEVADVDVVDAESAEVARRRILAERPDVIVLDINMPGTTGLELCAELKGSPATREIPIVLLTGSDRGTSADAKRAGADAFVRKPFSPLELLSVAERLAGGLYGVPFRAAKKRSGKAEEELLLYARDLRHMLEVEGLNIVRSHHERWDGRGYPDGLARDEIPLGARIFAVADALDAMTSHRPYRRALSWKAAREEVLGQRKRQFDPDVVDAFVAVEGQLRI